MGDATETGTRGDDLPIYSWLYIDTRRMIVELASTTTRARTSQQPTMKKLVVIKPSPLQQKTHTMAAATSQQHQQIIVLPSNLLLNSGKSEQQATIFRLAPSTTQATAAKVVQLPSIRATKRPAAPVSTAAMTTTTTSTMDDEDSDQPTRKRANLDHLTPEEKLMRRKLKNRVAAQNARDKKRVKMDEMEIKMKELEAEHARIKSENASLKANARLMEENKKSHACACGGGNSNSSSQVKVEEIENGSVVAPPSPPPSETGCPVSPASSSGSSDYSLVDSRSFESAEESGSRVGRFVDGNDDDNGSQGLLPCGGGGNGGDEDVQSALFDLEQLLFPNGDDVSGTSSLAVKEETHDVTGTVNGLHGGNGVGAAPLGMTSSWPHDVAAIKMEEEGFNAAAAPTASTVTAGGYGSSNNSCGVLDLDNCFSELFPDLAVAEAGIVM